MTAALLCNVINYISPSDETLNRGPDSLWSLKIPGCPSRRVEMWPRHPWPDSPTGLLIIPIHWLASSLGLLSISKLVCGGAFRCVVSSGGCCTLVEDEETPPPLYYVERFECPEKRYRNVMDYYYNWSDAESASVKTNVNWKLKWTLIWWTRMALSLQACPSAACVGGLTGSWQELKTARSSRWWWETEINRCWSCRVIQRGSSGPSTCIPNNRWPSQAATIDPYGQSTPDIGFHATPAHTVDVINGARRVEIGCLAFLKCLN